MATSAVPICNSALIKVGAERIDSLSDTTKRAVIVNEQYEKSRDDLMMSHPWNFAIARLELAQSATDPVNGWDAAFTLTNNVLRVLEINDDDSLDWAVEGGYVVTDETSCTIKYIKKITDTTLFPKIFEEVLAWKLAADICYAITQSSTLADAIYKKYELHLAKARSFDSQEGSGLAVEADDWINARL